MDDLDGSAAMLGYGIEELLRCIELPCVYNDKVALLHVIMVI